MPLAKRVSSNASQKSKVKQTITHKSSDAEVIATLVERSVDREESDRIFEQAKKLHKLTKKDANRVISLLDNEEESLYIMDEGEIRGLLLSFSVRVRMMLAMESLDEELLNVVWKLIESVYNRGLAEEAVLKLMVIFFKDIGEFWENPTAFQTTYKLVVNFHVTQLLVNNRELFEKSYLYLCERSIFHRNMYIMRSLFVTYRRNFCYSLRLERMIKHKLYKAMTVRIGTVKLPSEKDAKKNPSRKYSSSNGSNSASTSDSDTDDSSGKKNGDRCRCDHCKNKNPPEEYAVGDEKSLMDWVYITNIFYTLGDDDFFNHWNWKFLFSPWRNPVSGHQMFLFHYVWGFVLSNWIGIVSQSIYWKPIDNFINEIFPLFQPYNEYFSEDLHLPVFRSKLDIDRFHQYAVMCREDAIERGEPFIGFFNKIVIVLKCFHDAEPLSKIQFAVANEEANVGGEEKLHKNSNK